MNLSDRVSDQRVLVVDGYYEVVEDGYSDPMPILYYTCRGQDRQVTVSVEGYRPYFYVSAHELTDDLVATLDADHRVLSMTTECRNALDGTELVKITVTKPWQVRDLRDEFADTYEADVRFVNRFLIDQGVRRHMTVPSDADERTVRPHEVSGCDEEAIADSLEPRVCSFDIEVQQGSDDGPSVVSKEGTERARQPITAIAAHDSMSDEYTLYALRDDSWPSDRSVISGLQSTAVLSATVELNGGIHLFDDELSMLESFISDLQNVDVLTAWNADGFDVPYLVNRCHEIECWEIKSLSPTGKMDEPDGTGRFINGDVTGIHIFDMMDGYKKTQYKELKSSKLADVAAAETDLEKLDVGDIDQIRADDPSRFLAYVTRDTQAVVAINREMGVL